MKKILILNGPNLNLLGHRQPEIYGTRSMEDILTELREHHASLELEYEQSNHEGELVDIIQRAGYDTVNYCGIILNAGAYTHTSLALADAIAAVPLPVVEVHLSNVAAREPIRRQSLIAPVCAGSISGFGHRVYELAVMALVRVES